MPKRHLKAVPEPNDQPPLVDEPAQPTGPRTCAWCGQPATTQIMITPPEFGTSKGKRVLRKTGTWADSCRQHRRHGYNPLAKPVADAAERRRVKLAAKDQMTIHDMLEPDEPAS